MQMKTKIAKPTEADQLKNLSTEKLIIWIVGKCKEVGIKLTPEDIVIECWLINSEKHSLRGYNQFPDSQAVQKRIGEMKGKKGLLTGSEMAGYNLTEISRPIYADLNELILHHRIKATRGYLAAGQNY